MKRNKTLYHFLVIHESTGDRPVHLVAPTYSLGRDKNCSIPLKSHSVSRQHALLLRVPNPQYGNYQFRLLDGNATGKPSLNGIEVNGTRCSSHDLVDGDRIVLGGEVDVTYQIRLSTDPQRLAYHLDQPSFSAEAQSNDEECFTLLKCRKSLEKATMASNLDII